MRNEDDIADFFFLLLFLVVHLSCATREFFGEKGDDKGNLVFFYKKKLEKVVQNLKNDQASQRKFGPDSLTSHLVRVDSRTIVSDAQCNQRLSFIMANTQVLKEQLNRHLSAFRFSTINCCANFIKMLTKQFFFSLQSQ
jgi:hypothetical protein